MAVRDGEKMAARTAGPDRTAWRVAAFGQAEALSEGSA